MKDFKCMLAQPLKEQKLSFPCLVSPKLDGIRAQFYKGKLLTRNKNTVRGMTHLIEELESFSAMPLDGELMVPNMSFQKSSGKIRSFNETPDAHFYVFDAPYLDAPQDTRVDVLKTLIRSGSFEYVHLVPHFEVNSMAEIQSYYKRFRGDGLEGAMIKDMNGIYEGKRSYAWMKIKNLETYDVVCVGFFRGMGRLSDTLGGIIVELDGVRIRVGGGFSDVERDMIWNNKEQYQGKICTIAGQELTHAGSLRHPRLITWRFDIEAAYLPN